LADLTPEKFEYALRLGWDIAGLGKPLTHPMGWLIKLNNSILSPEQKTQVIGYLHANELGVDLGMRNTDIKNVKSLARSAGLSFRTSLEKQGGVTMELNLVSGSCDIKNSSLVCTDKEE
jgi:hypothetical protein